MVAAAQQGKLGLGPVAKDAGALAATGEALWLVDASLRERLDAAIAVEGRERQEASVEHGGRRWHAWIYE